MSITDAQIERYSRQIILPGIGGRGQQRLLQSGVSLLGTGAVALAAARYLTGAGIGRIDWLGGDHDLEHVVSAQRELTALNPDTVVAVRSLDRMRHEDHLMGSALVITAGVRSDVLLRVNDLALRRRAHLIAGAAGSRFGWVALYSGHIRTLPCAECAVPPAWDETDTTEALETPVAGVIGSVLALEAVKGCLGLQSGLEGRSLHFDADTSTMTDHVIAKRRACRACGTAAAGA
jgi:adenylyltransferase/sulfurtransferase